MTRLTIKLARAVAHLLDQQPEQWASDRDMDYEITHTSGISVWVANWQYGVHVQMHAPYQWFGSVTLASAFMLSPAHWIIWNAYRRWLRAHPLPPTGIPQDRALAIIAKAMGAK